MTGRDGKTPARKVRCAVYTRKSTDEGLDSDFNSLDAQREAAEAFIASQKAEGWICLRDRYDDGGYSGGSTDRPALRRLLTAIEAGEIDCIVVYKVDRLSRSLLDFARIMETLDRHAVSFVSVTQAFNTSSSMGRLTLNVLLSFAQFEREIIAERTRDKMSAARRKGKWVGGMPILGYDIDPSGGRLVVNEEEAAIVRTIFELYLDRQSLLKTTRELNRLRIPTKRWTTKAGTPRGGGPWDKTKLGNLLRNHTYAGKVRYRGETYDGEHPAIIDGVIWQRVQECLRRNGQNGGSRVRNRYGALLRGLLVCVPCGTSMVHTYTGKGARRYRYYVCLNAQKRGWDSCPSRSVPAAEIERFVVDQIRQIGKDRRLVAETARQARRVIDQRIEEVERQRDDVRRDLRRLAGEIRRSVGRRNGQRADRLADLHEQVAAAERRAAEIDRELRDLERQQVDEQDLAAALADFEGVWDSLSVREQSRLLHLLIERVGYNGWAGKVSVTFRPSGIRSLAAEATA